MDTSNSESPGLRVVSCFAVLLSCNLIWIACANPVSLGGGPRDEDPPVLLPEQSTANYQTYFIKDDIVLNFNEYVQLRDPARQVVISPPLDRLPQIQARGKSVQVSFDEQEVLKDNATYVINFGEAIQDFNESNPLSNFRFVFSTGAFIDSLSISGEVVDAFTGLPAENIYVMLYEQHFDSIVYNTRPFYFSSTDKSGQFRIENIRADSFKVFALKDANLNYLYDQESEAIGFVDSLIVVTDSTRINLSIPVFIETPDFGIREVGSDDYGLVLLRFSADAAQVDVDFNLNEDIFESRIIHQSNDSIWIWYDLVSDSSFHVYLNDGEWEDTVRLRHTNKSRFLQNAAFGAIRNNLERSRSLSPFKHLVLYFQEPIMRFDPEMMQITLDSLPEIIPYKHRMDSADLRKMTIEFGWELDSSYTLKIDSAAFTNIYGLVNDNTEISFTINSPESYGSIVINYADFLTDRQYIVRLVKEKALISKAIIASSEGKIEFLNLLPGTYGIELIEDLNSNGRWDPGNYLRKRQSERIVSKNLENLRANWELQEQLELSIFDND